MWNNHLKSHNFSLLYMSTGVFQLLLAESQKKGHPFNAALTLHTKYFQAFSSSSNTFLFLILCCGEVQKPAACLIYHIIYIVPLYVPILTHLFKCAFPGEFFIH